MIGRPTPGEHQKIVLEMNDWDALPPSTRKMLRVHPAGPPASHLTHEFLIEAVDRRGMTIAQANRALDEGLRRLVR